VKDKTQGMKEQEIEREWPKVQRALTFDFSVLPFDFALGS
jgi:hypothetical protein